MGDLTANLSRHEFACKCGCGFDTVNNGLAEIIQETADHFLMIAWIPDVVGISITINSGCRCYTHNKNEGGSKKSRHVWGQGVDFKIKFRMADGSKKQISPTKIANYLDKKFPNQYGVGWYNGRTHFDSSSTGRRRWDCR